MIHIQNLSLAFAGQEIFRDLNWFIKSGKRIGLIGANGAGKTTLLRILTGQYQPDSGEISMSASLTLGYLEQEIQEAQTDRSVLEEAMQAFSRIYELTAALERLHHTLAGHHDPSSPDFFRKLAHIERLQTELDGQEAHRIEDRTATVLGGLGFTAEEIHRPLASFSGGWRMRVALAKMLLRNPDVLLLDEPTNHLDIESISWLENYLRQYSGTVILVSHDRYFLNRMVDTIAELAYGRITEYAGNYAFYLEDRVARRELQQAAYENQQKEIQETERFIERFRYKATKARQVQSRVKALERLARLDLPEDELASVSFRFPEPAPSGRIVLSLSSYSKTYPNPEGDELRVFDHADPLTIERGDKIALVGRNGAGKSTLARMLLGTEPFEGSRELGYKVEMTYFAQHQAESLNPQHTILESLYEQAEGHTETQLRSLLGAFLFRGDDVQKPVSVLSGGERSRVALARTLLKPANFLILDEPTNHLDIQSITVLIEALRQYSGTFVVVSHDRHFLDQVANKIWYVAQGHTREFLGSYSDFEWKRRQQPAEASPQTTTVAATLRPEPISESTPPPKPADKNQRKRAEAEARNAFHKQLREANGDYSKLNWEDIEPQFLPKVIERIEGEIAEAEAKVVQLEAKMNDPALYEDLAAVQNVHVEYQLAQAHVQQLYTWWEAISERIE